MKPDSYSMTYVNHGDTKPRSMHRDLFFAQSPVAKIRDPSYPAGFNQVQPAYAFGFGAAGPAQPRQPIQPAQPV